MTIMFSLALLRIEELIDRVTIHAPRVHCTARRHHEGGGGGGALLLLLPDDESAKY